METDSPTAPDDAQQTVSAGTRRFSKTITLTYVGLGLFALLFIASGIQIQWQALNSRVPLLIAGSLIAFGIGIGIICIMWGLHLRRNWARFLSVSYWLICVLWSVRSILRNGMHPDAPVGAFQYSNEAQLEGARFGALVTPYFMVVLELSAIYCLLRKDSVVNQFRQRKI